MHLWQHAFRLAVDVGLVQGFDQGTVYIPADSVRQPLDGEHSPFIDRSDLDLVFPGTPVPGPPPFPHVSPVDEVGLKMVGSTALQLDVSLADLAAPPKREGDEHGAVT